MKNIIIIFLISFLHSQLIKDRSSFNYIDFDHSLNFHSSHSLNDSQLGVHNFFFSYDFYNNSIINYNQKFKDDNILFLYSFRDTLTKEIEFEISSYLQNYKESPIYSYSSYYNDEFLGFTGDIEKSYLSYDSNIFAFKIGRDYFSLGKFSEDRILFSTIGYPYDQIIFSFNNNNITISSFYLHLNPLKDGGIINNRHINGHRISYLTSNGYIALNDVAIYGGLNQEIHLPLFNPFNPLYVYQMNNNFTLNSIISLEYLFEINNNYFFLEFVIDDFQIEKKESADLEPTEFGFMFELGRKISENIRYNFNYTQIANRTFNAPVNIYEKMIYKQFPIGHYLGNNFWKVDNKLSLSYNKSLLSIEFTYLVKGEEALFSAFNTDFMNYSISEGYREEFPFGTNEKMNGFILTYNTYRFYNLNLSTTISYWFESFLGNKGLNYNLCAEYSFNL